jgi:hypothetical protein
MLTERLVVLVSPELASAIDEARGSMSRGLFVREAVATRLGLVEPDLPEVLPEPEVVVRAKAVASEKPKPVPAAKAGRSPVPSANNVQRYREKIEPLITGWWQTPKQIAEKTGIHERIVEKMLQGMDVEWQRGAVRLR